MRKSTVWPIFNAVSSAIGIVHTYARLVVSKMVSTFRVASGPMKERALISVRADSCCLIVLRAVHVWRIIKRLGFRVSDWPSSTLVHEVPMEARKWLVLCTFVLQKLWTLLNPELLQVCIMKGFLGLYVECRLSLIASDNRACFRGRWPTATCTVSGHAAVVTTHFCCCCCCCCPCCCCCCCLVDVVYIVSAWK